MKKRIALLAGILTVGMLSVLPASAAETSYTDVRRTAGMARRLIML